jgi:predicted phage terminase large subunit-like protein
MEKAVGDKEMRADTFSVWVNMGKVVLVNAPWNHVYVQELRFFPRSKYKDQVDASSGAFANIVKKRIKIGAF